MMKSLGQWVLSLPKPVGIMAANDKRARHLLGACRTYRLQVPEDVAVIGVDNDELLCQLSSPKLSSIEQDAECVGVRSSQHPENSRHVFMRILITGGAGFIGKGLADQLLRDGAFSLQGLEPHTIDKIILFDNVERENAPQDPRVESITGDINDARIVRKITQNIDLVWHLAAIVSAAAEADFDLGMNVNLVGLLTLLNALRDLKSRPRLVFASGFAVFGGNLPDVVTDFTALTPQSSYGTQKAIGELLVADYSRRGFIDGRAVRLPTITVRPGKPNKAASSFVSSIIREPLAGKPAVCPVRGSTKVYVSSPRRAVESMLLAMQLSEATIGSGRTIPLPGITVSVEDMVATLERIGGIGATKLIAWEPDSEIQRIVDSWPACVDDARARALGFHADADFEAIIRGHIEDELSRTARSR